MKQRPELGPFGAPIAYGFLSLSLIIPFWGELFDVDGVTTKVNYGLYKVRFTSPVKVFCTSSTWSRSAANLAAYTAAQTIVNELFSV